MKYNISCDYEYLREHLSELDKQNTHILLQINEFLQNNDKFYQLLSQLKYAEISLAINTNLNLTNDFIQYCVLNHIILYFYIEEQKDLLHVCLLRETNMDITIVLLICSDALEQFDDNDMKKITECNVHVCLIDNEQNYGKNAIFYNKLLVNGFFNLFITTINISLDKFTALIDRKSLSSFRFGQNILTRDEIKKLSLNTIKRYNKTLANNLQNNIEIVFINLNLSPNHDERKNLGIEYLAAVLSSYKYKVECLYLNQLNFMKEIEALIKKNPTLKAIGFSCMQDNLHTTKNAINFLKNKYPNLIFIIGGAQAIDLKEDFIRSNSVDYVMVGESEKNIIPLMNYIFNNEGSIDDIFGIRYINSDGNYNEHSQADLIQNLDSVPFPQYVNKQDDKLYHAGIITGRGCPFNCSFCYEGAKEKTVRYRSLSNVFEEISLLIKNKKNLKVIQFYDDTFTINKERVLTFCEKYKPLYEKYKIDWVCEVHCQTVYNEVELIKTMVDCGLKNAQIGLESCNNNILKKLNKQLTSDMIFSTIDSCQKAGLKRLEGNILIGGAGENKEQLDEQFDFSEKLLKQGRGMFELNISLFWPYPNTPITNNPEKYGVKILNDQCDYTINSVNNVVTKSNDVSRQYVVEHYYNLCKKIITLYDQMALQFTASEILKRWGNEIFSSTSKWAQAIIKYSYINRFLSAKFQNDVKLSPPVFPIRTFDLLSYDNNCLYLKEANVHFNILETNILELCNGKNSVLNISKELKISIDIIIEKLRDLEERMFIFCSEI